MRKYIVLCILWVLMSCNVKAVAGGVRDVTASSHKTPIEMGVSEQEIEIKEESHPEVKKKNNLLKEWFKQLVGGHKDRTFEKALDVSFAVAPTYTQEGSFGIGAMMTGLYRIDRSDSIMPPSDTQLIANISFTGQYSIIVKGNNLFKGNRSRISYDLTFQNRPLSFWGISYDECAKNAKSYYLRQNLKFDADYVYKVTPQFHVGALLNMRYTNSHEISDITYLNGQRRSYFLTGVGISINYDTRDFIPNPKRGFSLQLKEIVYPQFMGNGYNSIFSTTIIANYYQSLWKGATLALDLYGQYNGEDVPWPLRTEVGAGTSRMRGFYCGRYMDNNMISGQAELRQNIYKRIGVVAWVGYGTVFPSFDELHIDKLLLNYGVGLRFEFKHNVNLRLDAGFGEDSFGIIFGIAEAF